MRAALTHLVACCAVLGGGLVLMAALSALEHGVAR